MSQRFLTLFTVVLGGVSAVYGQSAPVIGPPVNAGSYLQNGLPNSGIALGSMFIIFGSGMNSASGVIYAPSVPLPTTLGGTTVSINVGGTITPAILSYVSAGQLAAILPSTTPTGTGTVTVSFGGKTSNTAPIQVVSNAFGALAYNASGIGPAVIFNNSQSGQPVNNLLTAAAPGEVAELWGTGLGPVVGSDTGLITQSNVFGAQTTVYVGGVASPQVQYAGRSTFAGIDQINFVIPTGVSGCYVPVYVVINSVPSNTTTMAIASGDGPCSDPVQLSSADISTFQSGKSPLTFGFIQATHFSYDFNFTSLGGTVVGSYDQLNANFQKIPNYQIPFMPGFINQGIPSLGYCVVGQYTYNGSILGNVTGSQNYPVTSSPIGAGNTLTITGPNGPKTLQETAAGSGQYKATLGGGAPGSTSLPAYFVAGNYTVANSAGDSIGQYSATMTLPANLTWTNEPSPAATFPRSQGLVVNWTGASAGEVVGILGNSVNTTTNAAATFTCSAPGSAGTFTVPSAILSMLPASGSVGFDKIGFLTVGKASQRTGTSFTAPNMDIGFLNYQEALITNVVYQ